MVFFLRFYSTLRARLRAKCFFKKNAASISIRLIIRFGEEGVRHDGEKLQRNCQVVFAYGFSAVGNDGAAVYVAGGFDDLGVVCDLINDLIPHLFGPHEAVGDGNEGFGEHDVSADEFEIECRSHGLLCLSRGANANGVVVFSNHAKVAQIRVAKFSQCPDVFGGEIALGDKDDTGIRSSGDG